VIVLRDLTETDLPAVRPWFEDDDTRHWLGGWTWPAGKLTLAGPDRCTMLAFADDVAAGLVDIEMFEARRAAFAIVVSPSLRRSGLGRAIVAALIAQPRFADVVEWLAGVETGNVASRRLLLGCGFIRVTDEDAEGFSYFARRRSGWPRLPWTTPWSGTETDTPVRPRDGKLSSRDRAPFVER